MAAVAKFRDDLGGSITTGGTSTAYTLTSFQVFTALQAGLFVAFNPNVTNGATVTINVDSLGAKPLRSAPNVELQAGALVAGTPYVAAYFTSNSGEWIVYGTANPYNVPIGGVMPYVGTTAPNSSFALMYGQAISRTTYATLFALTSTTWGTGDGSTTFNVPDLRGRTVFGQDNMGGSAASRITVAGGNWDGTVLESTARGAQNVTLTSAQLASHTHALTGTLTTGVGGVAHTHTLAYGGTTGTLSAGSNPFIQTIGSGASSANTGAASATDHTHSVTLTGTNTDVQPTTRDQSHPNMPPAMVLPYIMRII